MGNPQPRTSKISPTIIYVSRSRFRRLNAGCSKTKILQVSTRGMFIFTCYSQVDNHAENGLRVFNIAGSGVTAIFNGAALGPRRKVSWSRSRSPMEPWVVSPASPLTLHSNYSDISS